MLEKKGKKVAKVGGERGLCRWSAWSAGAYLPYWQLGTTNNRNTNNNKQHHST